MKKDDNSRRDRNETVIQWFQGDEIATLSSLIRKDWRSAEKAGGELIDETRRKGKVGSRTYLVPRSSIQIRPRRKLNLSEEARTKRRENLRRGRRSPTLPDSLSNDSGENTDDPAAVEQDAEAALPHPKVDD